MVHIDVLSAVEDANGVFMQREKDDTEDTPNTRDASDEQGDRENSTIIRYLADCSGCGRRLGWLCRQRTLR